MGYKMTAKTKEGIREILANVYCDGQVNGAGATCKMNYKDIDQALTAIESLLEKEKMSEEEIFKLLSDVVNQGLFKGEDTETIIRDQAKALHDRL